MLEPSNLSPFERILVKAMEDKAWAERLLRQPQAALAEIGFDSPTTEQLIALGEVYGPLRHLMSTFGYQERIG